jgi:hypothetical protein
MPLGNPKPETLKIEGDFGKFTETMKRVVSMPKAELQRRLEAEKKAKKRGRMSER